MPMNGKHTVDRQAPVLQDPVQVIGLIDHLVQNSYRRLDKIQDQHKDVARELDRVLEDLSRVAELARNSIRNGGSVYL